MKFPKVFCLLERGHVDSPNESLSGRNTRVKLRTQKGYGYREGGTAEQNKIVKKLFQTKQRSAFQLILCHCRLYQSWGTCPQQISH